MTEYIADVSEFQETIDWPAYGAAYHGVIIRAHNGNRPDNYWTRNRDGARANVLWRGYYQYLPANVDPVAAARAFQATTGPLLPGEVAILDLEEGAGDQRGRRQAWLDTLQDPIEWTYSGLAFARAHLPGVSVEWIAAYGQSEPTVPHTLWQFTNARSFAGIAKPCDGSIFHGTIEPGLTGDLGRSIGGGTPVLTPTGTTTPLGDDMTPDQEHKIDTLIGQGEALLALLRVPGQPYGYPQATQNAIAEAVPLIQETRDRVRGTDPAGDVLQILTARVAALQSALDPGTLASAVTAALPASALTQAQVETAAEQAIRTVLGALA